MVILKLSLQGSCFIGELLTSGQWLMRSTSPEMVYDPKKKSAFSVFVDLWHHLCLFRFLPSFSPYAPASCLPAPTPISTLLCSNFRSPRLSSSHSAADCGKARKSSSSHSANTLGTPSYPAAPINSDVCPVASGTALATWITYKYTHKKLTGSLLRWVSYPASKEEQHNMYCR